MAISAVAIVPSARPLLAESSRSPGDRVSGWYGAGPGFRSGFSDIGDLHSRSPFPSFWGEWEATCLGKSTTSTFGFEPTSKRRHGYPSEAQVKRGNRVVGGHKELIEKLGRNDPCPCGSGRRFQAVLPVFLPDIPVLAESNLPGDFS